MIYILGGTNESMTRVSRQLVNSSSTYLHDIDSKFDSTQLDMESFDELILCPDYESVPDYQNVIDYFKSHNIMIQSVR